jgi:formylglycine-generating enzyme required for sulfatase activity
MSGNVLEWTRSLLADYPYPADLNERRQREDLRGSQDKPRGLRGGAVWINQRRARCALRGRYAPAYACDLVGFRVVVHLKL